MKSIIHNNKCCFFCGRFDWIERHHIMHGPHRKKSEKYGLTVYLCHYCHNEPPEGVHHNGKRDLILKQIAQTEFDKIHGGGAFFKEFGKNYI